MKIAIIGAGLAGLTAAYELRDHEVDVFEADARRFTPTVSCTPCPPRQSWGFLQPLMPLRD